jgi:hypothetical protein
MTIDDEVVSLIRASLLLLPSPGGLTLRVRRLLRRRGGLRQTLRQEAPHPVRQVRLLVPRPRLAPEQEPQVEPEPRVRPPRAAPVSAAAAAAPRGSAGGLAHEGGAAAARWGTGGGAGGEGARGGGVESGRRGHLPG